MTLLVKVIEYKKYEISYDVAPRFTNTHVEYDEYGSVTARVRPDYEGTRISYRRSE